MKIKTLLILLATLLPAFSVFGAEASLQPILDKQHLGIALSDISWSDSLAKDLSSGFENRIVVRTTLVEDSLPTASVDITLLEKYDLWDEIYYLKVKVGEQERETKSIKSVNELILYLSKLRFDGLFVIAKENRANSVQLIVDILVNPVSREKMEKLNEWIAQNSTPHLIGANAPGSRRTGAQSTLFNSIYGQYVRGADLVAPWKLTVTSKPFALFTVGKE